LTVSGVAATRDSPCCSRTTPIRDILLLICQMTIKSSLVVGKGVFSAARIKSKPKQLLASLPFMAGLRGLRVVPYLLRPLLGWRCAFS
jgi:hypothetical protein